MRAHEVKSIYEMRVIFGVLCSGYHGSRLLDLPVLLHFYAAKITFLETTYNV